MQMVYLMILMIDPCNSNADLSIITAADVCLYAFSSVSYSETNELERLFQNNFIRMLYFMILMIYPCNSYVVISEITATAVSIGVSSLVPYSELNKE
jgi:hypothetical protein